MIGRISAACRVRSTAAGRTPRCPSPSESSELMRRMTLAEKVAQLGSRWVGERPQGHGGDHESDAAEPTDPIT